MRILFAGTPKFAADHLKALIDGGREVVGVYTQPDRASGRGHRLSPSAVKTVAMEAGIPVEQPVSLRSPEAESVFRSFRPDVFVVAAYGLIIPENILNIPLYGCINIHGSLLPRWRGAAPVQRAILEGDDYTGITVMQMDKGLDTGVMLSRRMCPIAENETSGSLFEKLTVIGIRAMNETLDRLDAGITTGEPQNDDDAVYANKITKDDARIVFIRSADYIGRQVRAFNPDPGAWFTLDGQKIKVSAAHPDAGAPDSSESAPGTVLRADAGGIAVKTGDGTIILDVLQLPGKKAIPAKDILNGHRDLFRPGRIIE